MKLLLFCLPFLFVSCSTSPADKVQLSVKDYLKGNLKKPETYKSLSFSSIDTLKKPDTSQANLVTLYAISHTYEITNSDLKIVKMFNRFFLDKDLKVNDTESKSFNGEYGSLSGNAYWKYNDYVGNKPDAGAAATLYGLDSTRQGLKFEAVADVKGDYKIDKLLPGGYFLVVRSKNTTDCPYYHVFNLDVHRKWIKDAFGLDVDNYRSQVDEIMAMHDKAQDVLYEDTPGLNALTRKLDRYNAMEEIINGKADSLIRNLPREFQLKVMLPSGYGNALYFKWIHINEGEDKSVVSDFGITCI